MDVWDRYLSRMQSLGGDKRSSVLKREINNLRRKLPDSLSYTSVLINNAEQKVSIINSDNLNEKKIISLPGESIECGSLVDWKGNMWLVTEIDANDTIYTKGIMLQCNYNLKWIDKESVIHDQWCVIEDGTKYLTGEFEDPHFIVTRGDSRISVTIGRNADTASMRRGDRFIIDDEMSSLRIAYTLTKPLKVGHVYNGHGVYKFVMQESVVTDYDNQELAIADYYKHFNHDGTKKTTGTTLDDTREKDNDGRWF